jgi:hypothetical protein
MKDTSGRIGFWLMAILFLGLVAVIVLITHGSNKTSECKNQQCEVERD